MEIWSEYYVTMACFHGRELLPLHIYNDYSIILCYCMYYLGSTTNTLTPGCEAIAVKGLCALRICIMLIYIDSHGLVAT